MSRTFYVTVQFILILFSLVFFLIENLDNEYIYISRSMMLFVYALGWLLSTLYAIAFLSSSFEASVTSFYQIYYYFTMLISATIVSFHAYMFEIRSIGTPNGVFWIMIIFMVITMSCIKEGYRYRSKTSYKRNAMRKRHISRTASKIVIIATLASSLAILLLYGSPISNEVTRTNYWKDIVPSGLSAIRIVFVLSFFFVAALSLKVKDEKYGFYFGRLCIVAYLFLAIVLFGEKVSMFVLFLYAGLIVYAAKPRKRMPRSIAVGIPVTMIGLVLYAGYVYDQAGLSFSFLFMRAALQAQVAWSTMNESSGILLFGAFLMGEYIDIGSMREFLSTRYLPVVVQKAHAISGTTLSGYSPSWQIIAFGIPLAVVVTAVFAFFVGFLQHKIVSTLRSGEYIYAFLLFAMHFFMIASWYVANFGVLPVVIALLYLFLIASLSSHRSA